MSHADQQSERYSAAAAAGRGQPAAGDLPLVLGGGMGVGVSMPALVRAVSDYVVPGYGPGRCLGIASGTAAANLLASRLQLGDPGVRPAFDALARVAPGLEPDLLALHARYFVPGGKPAARPYRRVPTFDLAPSRDLVALTIAGSFVMLWECKQGDPHRIVGINYLQKLEIAQVPALFGAVLAGADYVCIGAGNPASVPEYLRRLARGERIEQPVHVARAAAPATLCFDPAAFLGNAPAERACSRFIAIVGTVEQAERLAASEATRPFGFVFERPSAGGHNAPPAGYRRFLGERPTWGPDDELDVAGLKRLEQPFWLAGGYGNPQGLRRALELGAAGVQVGTTLGFCEESGMAAPLREQTLGAIWTRGLEVHTEPLMSPTGFPFKVAQLPGTISEPAVREAREAHACCDHGHLATPVQVRTRTARPDGTTEERTEVQMVCPAEPLAAFTRKGGSMLRRKGSICLCNALMSTAGFPAVRGDGYSEAPIVTIGDASVRDVHEIQKRERSRRYSAAAALRYVFEGLRQVT